MSASLGFVPKTLNVHHNAVYAVGVQCRPLTALVPFGEVIRSHAHCVQYGKTRAVGKLSVGVSQDSAVVIALEARHTLVKFACHHPRVVVVFKNAVGNVATCAQIHVKHGVGACNPVDVVARRIGEIFLDAVQSVFLCVVGKVGVVDDVLAGGDAKSGWRMS